MAEGTPDVTLGTLHNDLVDIKGGIGGLRGEMSGMRNELSGVRDEMGGLRAEMSGLRDEMGGLRGEMSGLRDEMGGLRGEMSGLRDEMGGLRGEMGGLKTEMGGLKTEMGGLRGDVRDLKATVIAGFARLPTREQHDELVGYVREANRSQDAGFAELRSDLRAMHVESRELLRALVDGQRILIEVNRTLSARIEAIIRRQSNGGPPDSATAS